MNLLKGNKSKIVFGYLLYSDKTKVTNLNTAVNVRWVLKHDLEDADSAAIISKSLGPSILIDTPSTSKITIILETADTELVKAGIYYQALQIEYPNDNIQEIIIMEKGKLSNIVYLLQDGVRAPV